VITMRLLTAAIGLIGGPTMVDAQATGLARGNAPTGHRVQVNGMQMYYEVSGQGGPLIVLHGAYMNIPAMGAIIPALGRNHRVQGE
jgi:hypothetical protein